MTSVELFVFSSAIVESVDKLSHDLFQDRCNMGEVTYEIEVSYGIESNGRSKLFETSGIEL